MARRLGAAPIGYDDHGHLLVAMSDPSNVLALDDLKLRTGREVQPVVASPDDINGLIGRMSRLDEAVAEAVQEGEEELADVTEIRESAEDGPVIKLVNSIIAQAVEEGASDIHFEPEGREMRVRFRVDGVLRETTTIPKRMIAGVVSRVKIMASLDIAEKRVPQDGRVSLTVEGHAIDTRVVTMPRVDGEGIVMRILDKTQALIGLDSLGMSRRARTSSRTRSGAPTAPCSSPARPGRASPPRSTRRSTRSTSPGATSSRSRTRWSTSSPGSTSFR